MASSSITRRPDGSWRARYRGCTECPDRPKDHEHAKHFTRKSEGQDWLSEQLAKINAGTHVSPKQARTTVEDWCDIWLAAYKGNRASTVRQAEVHISRIKMAFGSMPLSAVRPSQVKTWCAQLRAEGLADSYIYALHARLSQIYTDAIDDGLVPKSPCSRKTSPKMGEQRAYVATTEQFWGLHDAMPEHLRAAVLLGGLAGLRLSEACGLRVSDVDFMRGVITPAVQYSEKSLKTEASRQPVPIPHSAALELSAHVAKLSAKFKGDEDEDETVEWVLADMWGHQLTPWTLERAIRAAREKVPGLSPAFRYHDLRHYLASYLIANGKDLKEVQEHLRHASAATTLRTYIHLFEKHDDNTRTTLDGVMSARPRAAG